MSIFIIIFLHFVTSDDKNEIEYSAIVKRVSFELLITRNKSDGDKETLLDSATIMRYLAEAYNRLGRFAVSVRYYKRAIELAAKLYTMYGEEIKDNSGMVYNALKARNYYVDDDCEDIRELALTFISKELVDDVFLQL